MGGNTGQEGPGLVPLLDGGGALQEEQPAGQQEDDEGSHDEEEDGLEPHIGQDDQEVDQQTDQEDQIDEVDQEPRPDLRGISKTLKLGRYFLLELTSK